MIYLKKADDHKEWEHRRNLIFLLIGCHGVATFHEGRQLLNQGLSYFSDTWNYFDLTHIFSGVANLYVQLNLDTFDKYGKEAKTLMIVTTINLLIKVLYFLRIFKPLT